jgi:hypothetical protein
MQLEDQLSSTAREAGSKVFPEPQFSSASALSNGTVAVEHRLGAGTGFNIR